MQPFKIPPAPTPAPYVQETPAGPPPVWPPQRLPEDSGNKPSSLEPKIPWPSAPGVDHKPFKFTK